MKPSDEERIATDPNWWDMFRKVQAMYDTREDTKRQPTLALAVAAIIIVSIIAYGFFEYINFFFDKAGSKYD